MPSQVVGRAAEPFVRVVVLNWNSAWFTRRCIRALQETDYPADRVEVVLVDNGSIDGSLELLRREFPELRIIANGVNLGFAEGCNRGMRDRGGVDHVALVNNDTVVEPGWLRSLVDVLESDPDVGAVAARLVLEPAFVPVEVAAVGSLSLHRVTVDGMDVTAAVRPDGFEASSAAEWPLDITFRLADAAGCLWVPAGPAAREVAVSVLGPGRLANPPVGAVVAADGRSMVMEVPAIRTQLLNGVGTALNERCEGYDIGYGKVDRDDLSSAEVDGFCGGGALLRGRMLDEVGLFQPRLFAYYEDSDLSWRARRAGWRIVTAPDSVIHHAFGASAGTRARGFFYLDRRNWWLTAERNGTPEQIAEVRATAMRSVRAAFRANVLARARHGRRPSFTLLATWARVAIDVLIERRRSGEAAGPVGLSPVRSVTGRFQPRPSPRPATPRPWGPQLVYFDVTGAPDDDSTGRGELIVRILTLCSRVESLDLVPILRGPDGSVRRIASDEMAVLVERAARRDHHRGVDSGLRSGSTGDGAPTHHRTWRRLVSLVSRRLRRPVTLDRDRSPLELDSMAVGSVELTVDVDSTASTIPTRDAAVPRVTVAHSDGRLRAGGDSASDTFVADAGSFDELAAAELAEVLARVGRAAWTARASQCRDHREAPV